MHAGDTALGHRDHPKEQLDVFADNAVLSLDGYKSLAVTAAAGAGAAPRSARAMSRTRGPGCSRPRRRPVAIPLEEPARAMRIAFAVEESVRGSSDLLARHPGLQRGGGAADAVRGARSTPRAARQPAKVLLVDGGPVTAARRRWSSSQRATTASSSSGSPGLGGQLAITAGLDLARGDATVVMDADLQDPPEVARDGEALASRASTSSTGSATSETARRGSRLTAHAFYRLFSRMTDVDVPVDVGDFGSSTGTRWRRSGSSARTTATCAACSAGSASARPGPCRRDPRTAGTTK